MAKADRHNMGPGTQGKGSGTGAMTELPEGILEENMVLSNRDKAQHNQERGLDSTQIQTEQYHDHVAKISIQATSSDQWDPPDTHLLHLTVLLSEMRVGGMTLGLLV